MQTFPPMSWLFPWMYWGCCGTSWISVMVIALTYTTFKFSVSVWPHTHSWELFSCEQYHVSFVDFCQYLLSKWSGNNHLWPTQNATTLGTQLETSIKTWLEFLGDLSQFWPFVFHLFNDLLENMVFCCFSYFLSWNLKACQSWLLNHVHNWVFALVSQI